MSEKKPTFTVSSGNLYADVGLPDAEALHEQAGKLIARPKEPFRIYVDADHPYPNDVIDLTVSIPLGRDE